MALAQVGGRHQNAEMGQFFLAVILTSGYVRDESDFRIITAFSGRCGKPKCRCHQPNQPSHDLSFRLMRKVNGKSVSETFASPAELRSAKSWPFTVSGN